MVAGAIAVTPDNMPVASAVPALSGFNIVSGGGHGLTRAPALGKVMADLVAGRKPAIAVEPFRYQRFFDGTRRVLRH